MTKHLYRHAASLQENLLEAAALHPPDEWARHVERIHLDAWASLWRWHDVGDPILRITGQHERRALDCPLDPDLCLATAKIKREALALQLQARREWIVIARHAPAPAVIPVHGDVRWAYRQPVLTYASSGSGTTEGSLGSGYVSLTDQPTPADIGAAALGRGTVRDLDGREKPVDDAALAEDDWRLSLALHALFSS